VVVSITGLFGNILTSRGGGFCSLETRIHSGPGGDVKSKQQCIQTYSKASRILAMYTEIQRTSCGFINH